MADGVITPGNHGNLPTGTAPSNAPASGNPFDPTQQSALDLINQTLAAWGLSSLSSTAASYIQQGLTSDEITLKLQQTDQYKTRFAGNAIRQANGLSTLDPASYIALEEQYRQVLNQYGLPAGFYDKPSDYNNWIGGDVSPAELQSRAQIAQQTFLDADPNVKSYWSQFGLSQGQAVASILDPQHESLADLQRQATAVQLGGTAADYGIGVDTGRALNAADQGVSLATARQAYQRIQSYGQTDSAIANRFGSTFNTNDELDSLLLNQSAPDAKRNLVYGEEAAQFSGRGGVDVSSLAPGANY